LHGDFKKPCPVPQPPTTRSTKPQIQQDGGHQSSMDISPIQSDSRPDRGADIENFVARWAKALMMSGFLSRDRDFGLMTAIFMVVSSLELL
jgi:hypothetical protein